LVKTSTNYVANNASEKDEIVATARRKNNNDDKDEQKYESDFHVNKLSLMILCV